MELALATLGVALGELSAGVRESGGNNRGHRVGEYLANTDPPIHQAAPWCAAFVQFCSDVAAIGLGVDNPLDAVKRQAFVNDYWDFFRFGRVDADAARPGDLVLYSFGGERMDHMGILARPVRDGVLHAVEGNTSDASQRDGDAVAMKRRRIGDHATSFVRWNP